MQIVVSNIKGGSGKSTVAAAIASVLDVDLVDHDNQGTLRVTASFSGLNKPVGAKDITKEIVLHDTPPYNDVLLKSLFEMADMVIIPCRVKYPDLVAVRGVIDILRELNEAQKGLILFNDVRKPHNNTYREIKELYHQNYTDIKKAKTEFSSLIGFTRVFTEKLKGQALKETKQLLEEVGLLNLV